MELVLGEEGGKRRAVVQQALHATATKFPEAHQVGYRSGGNGRQQWQRWQTKDTFDEPVIQTWACCRHCRLFAVVPATQPESTPPLHFRLNLHHLQDSAVGFQIQLESGVKLQAHVYLCYDRQLGAAATASGCGPALVPGSDHFAW